MTSYVQTEVAEAIKTTISGLNFSILADPAINLVFSRNCGQIDMVLKNVNPNKVYVDVIPRSVKTTIIDRESQKYSVITTVCVRCKLNPQNYDSDTGNTTNDQLDPLLQLLQEIHDYLCPLQPTTYGRTLGTLADARWEEGEIQAPFDMYLREHSQFLGLVLLTYSLVRSPQRVSVLL